MKNALCLMLLLCAMPAFSQPAPSTQYADDLLRALPAMVQALPNYVKIADTIAPLLAQGGKLWLAGDRGFVLEGLNRAGGLMMVKQLPKMEAAQQGDVVLYGTFGQPSAEQARDAKAMRERLISVVEMTPARVALNGLSIELQPPTGPTQAAPLLTASLWTLSGEIVSALTRLGKMPPLWQSVMVPGGRERNAPHLKLQWERGEWQPIRAGLLGREYLATIANNLRCLKVSQAQNMAAAGKMAAQTRREGHTVWYASLGHLPPELPKIAGDPQMATPLPVGPGPEKLGECVKPGDLIIYVGYYEPYGPWVEKAHELGAQIVTVVSGTPQRPAEAMGADLNIDACWAYGDAAVAVPGYDIKFLPPSGFIAAAAYYMLMNEVKGASDSP
ncbi:MAG: hypothetical protein ACYC63_13360 [Armatimonadota bacterium]